MRRQGLGGLRRGQTVKSTGEVWGPGSSESRAERREKSHGGAQKRPAV